MNLMLTTERLILRVLFEEYAPATAAFYQKNREYLSQWEPNVDEHLCELTSQQACLRYEFDRMKQGRFLRYWYSVKEQPDLLIGSVCFRQIKGAPFHSCEIGYKQDADYCGLGFATEAIGASIHHLFTENSIHRMEALIEPHNLPSLHIAEQMGFEREGLARQVVFLRGGWRDCYRYALINESSAR